jgi:hypothetical protein
VNPNFGQYDCEEKNMFTLDQATKAFSELKNGETGLLGLEAKLLKGIEERKNKLTILQGEVNAFEVVQKIVKAMIVKSGLESIDLTPAPTSSKSAAKLAEEEAPVAESKPLSKPEPMVDPLVEFNAMKQARAESGLCTYRGRDKQWCEKKLRGAKQREAGLCKEHMPTA